MRQFGRLKDTGSLTFQKKNFHFDLTLFSKGDKMGMRGEVPIEFVYLPGKNKFSNLRNTE